MIIGVGFLLFSLIDGAFKVFTVEELKGKPENKKEAGMMSFPLETFEVKDICPRNTITRLIREEIGVPIDQVEIMGFSFQEFRPIPGREDITILYGFGKFSGDPNQEFKPKDDDIKFVGWFTPKELLNRHFVRVEVPSLLAHFATNFSEKLNEQK